MLVTTALLVVAGTPLTWAGSVSDPEISDGAGDVSPASFAASSAQNESFFENQTAYDITKAWVGVESSDAFWIIIHVKDLPDGWGLPASPPEGFPFGPNVTYAGTSLVANFTLGGVVYQAVAKLAMPGEGELLDNYTLWKGGAWAPLSGAFNTTQDWIAMKIPKAAFGGVSDGALLTKFWVMGRYANRSMDYAPNAKDFAGTTDPLVLAGRIASGQLVEAQFGRDYMFGQYYHAGAGGGGGGGGSVVPALALSVQGDAQKRIDAGQMTSYDFLIRNDATAPDTVYLALNSAPEGWSHQLDATQFTLEPGGARLVMLSVAAADTATEALRSIVDASSSLGASKSASVLTLVEPKAMPSDSEGPSPSDGSGGPFPSGGERGKGGVPGFEVPIVAASLAALLGARRRRNE